MIGPFVFTLNPPPEAVAHLEMVLQEYIDNPTGELEYADEYKHRYFDMVREMKDDHYMASQPSSVVIPILQRLRDLRELGYDTSEEAAEDLAILWDKVKLGQKEGPLEAAARMADFEPFTFKTSHYGAKYQRFLNIAYRLQAIRGDDYITLPVVRLGEILSVSPMRISDFRGFAIADSFLREVGKAHHFSKMATKFRFDGVDVLSSHLEI